MSGHYVRSEAPSPVAIDLYSRAFAGQIIELWSNSQADLHQVQVPTVGSTIFVNELRKYLHDKPAVTMIAPWQAAGPIDVTQRMLIRPPQIVRTEPAFLRKRNVQTALVEKRIY